MAISINVGIDFGSTYTAVSIFDEDMNLVKALSLEGDTPYIPSLVAKEDRGCVRFSFGRTAKSKTGKSKVKVFKAFKMLLNERNPEILKERGYAVDLEDGYTPEEITRRFLEHLLKKAMDSVHAEYINQVVIGIPEIWNEMATYGGRKVLRDICCGFPFVKDNNVQVISEPACASAFIAYKYLNQYEGKVLLIDYGGGTLDITLSSVTTDASGSLEIKVLEKKGAGENLDQKVGKAGIIYQETVVERAILQAYEKLGIKEELVYDDDFYARVNELEIEIIGRKEDIEACFGEYNLNLKRMKMDMEESLESDEYDDSWRFTTLDYKGEDIDVSYALLLEVYNEVISPTLDKQLTLIQEYMTSHGISYMDGTTGKFKIAIVGGFGKYYPVRKQVETKFGLSSLDNRRINMPESDAEQAISLGAALLAEGKVRLQKTSAFSFGLLLENGLRKQIIYAINYKQNIIPKDINYLVDEEGAPYVFMLMGKIQDFVLNFGADDRTAARVRLKKSVQERLNNIKMNQYRTAKIGFSFDESEVITMHVEPCNPITKESEDMGNTEYVLSRFDELFDITIYKAVR